MRAMKEPESEIQSHQFVKPKNILRRCWMTGKPFTITVEEDGYMEWLKEGNLKPLSVCLPMLTPEEQELLTSGLSAAGFEAVMGHALGDEDANEYCAD